MKRSFDPRTYALFWGARTSINQNHFWKLSDVKFHKYSNKHIWCLNEQMPKPTYRSFRNKLSAHSMCAQTSMEVLEWEPSCSNEHLGRVGCFGFVVTCLLILCLKPLDSVLRPLNTQYFYSNGRKESNEK